MLVLLQTAIPADGTVVEEGFSKLQVFLQQLIDWGVAAGGNIIGAILIFVIGRFLISLIKKMVSKLLEKRHVDAGIQSFVKSLVNILLTILLIIAVIGKLGVETICIFILCLCIAKDKIMLFYAFFFHFIWLFAKYIVILQPLNE